MSTEGNRDSLSSTLCLSNAAGEEPFLNMNPATPNGAYFANLDHIVKVAQGKGLVVVILPCGGSGGSFVDKKKIVTKEMRGPMEGG